MAYRTGFFDAIDSDRTYGAADMSHYYEGLISDGVLANFGRGCKVLSNNDMSVSITPGKAYINGRYIQIDSNEVLTLDQASSSLNRIDAIVLRFDNSQAVRNIVPTVKKGEPASNPVVPAIENTIEVKEICIATVYIKALASAFTDSSITDTRANTDICGFVTGLITQVDTADLFLQWQTAYEEQHESVKQWINSYENELVDWETSQKIGFEAWFSSLTEQLNVDTYVKRYRRKFVTSSALESFDIDIPEYESGDIIDIYINGIHLNYDEYIIESGVVYLGWGGVIAQQEIQIEVTKSKIGYQVKSQDI